jgi:nucleoid DNA-binding protein
MNRSDLISRLKDNIDIKRQDAEKIVDTFFDALKER